MAAWRPRASSMTLGRVGEARRQPRNMHSRSSGHPLAQPPAATPRSIARLPSAGCAVDETAAPCPPGGLTCAVVWPGRLHSAGAWPCDCPRPRQPAYPPPNTSRLRCPLWRLHLIHPVRACGVPHAHRAAAPTRRRPSRNSSTSPAALAGAAATSMTKGKRHP